MQFNQNEIEISNKCVDRELTPRVVNFYKNLNNGSILKAHTPRNMHKPKSFIGNNLDRFSFLMSPLDSNILLKFKIVRSKGLLSTIFKMYYEDTSEFIINAEKQLCHSPYYHISMIENEFCKLRGFVGKVRGD